MVSNPESSREIVSQVVAAADAVSRMHEATATLEKKVNQRITALANEMISKPLDITVLRT